MPQAWGKTTQSAAAAATAVSIALPPARATSSPAVVASGCPDATAVARPLSSALVIPRSVGRDMLCYPAAGSPPAGSATGQPRLMSTTIPFGSRILYSK
jgi:hypothetical protein